MPLHVCLGIADGPTTLIFDDYILGKRGDIVVFYSPLDGKRLVKRVVAVPGDSIAMQNDQLIINGEGIKYEPGSYSATNNSPLSTDTDQLYFIENLGDTRHSVMITPQRPALRSFSSVAIPDGKYFMMGDNRDNSADSRYIGLVDRSRIVGQATSIVISLDLHNNYKPRWGRFFTQLP